MHDPLPPTRRVASTGAPDSRTRLLDSALHVFRAQGYTATTVDKLCHSAGVTKGSFFHHFDSKEALALAAIDHWNQRTGALFASAPFWQEQDPRARLLAYLDFRTQLLQGDLPDYTCLLGTLVQETYANHPALQTACGAGMAAHASTLVPTIEAARALHAPQASWSAQGLATYIQVVIQGAFVMAKAQNTATAGSQLAQAAIAQLRAHVAQLLPDAAAA